MEDFGSILWLLIIVGAMIFNFVSKSRKARGKGDHHTPHHDEAWPSAPDADAEIPMRPLFQPVTPAFPDECQSLEEIPEQEYVPEFTVQKAADGGHFQHQTANRLHAQAGTDEIAARAVTDEIGMESSTEIAEEFDLRRAVIYSEILKPKFGE